ncbi:MAG: NAD(P)H-dependent oxidoreductase [Actinobacteria bacterium]|nr:NAD(P)H-dependent oxidoreductase [Actinomycetota bacterium]
MKIGIIVGSTRPGRRARPVAEWVHQVASQRTDATFELVDVSDYALPLLDEPMPAMTGTPYTHAHTLAWSETIRALDGFIIVTPEYNHGTSAALKNALDYLYAEWNNKAVGFVSYGTNGGVRAVETLRMVAGDLQMADVTMQVALSIFSDFTEEHTVLASDYHLKRLDTMLDQLIRWTTALASARRS